MGHKVLLADDSITVQKIVKLSLTEEGIEVIALGNGEQAVQQLETIQPDLVMADVFMPGKDGYEVCEFVKAHPQFKHTPVILLVHAFEPFDPERAKKVGADQQLTKPFQSIRTLVTTVRDLLSTSRSAVVAREEINASIAVGSASKTTLSPTISGQPEEEFAVVSSLAMTAETKAEPAPAVINLPDPEVSSVSPSLDSFQPLPASNLPIPLVSSQFSDEAATLDFLPPLELAILPSNDWQAASVASATPALSEMDMPVFSPVSLAATPLAMSEISDDVLDLSDVLPLQQERVSPSLDFSAAAPSPEDFVLATLASVAPSAEPSIEEIPPKAQAILDNSSYGQTFDVGIGQISLNAPSIPSAPEPTTQAQDVQAGVVGVFSTNDAVSIPEAVIEEIVNRVVQRLSAQAIQEIAWEVVPEMAELMIRKQISQHPQLSH